VYRVGRVWEATQQTLEGFSTTMHDAQLCMCEVSATVHGGKKQCVGTLAKAQGNDFSMLHDPT
jgi:hypothetical protein